MASVRVFGVRDIRQFGSGQAGKSGSNKVAPNVIILD